MEKCKEDTPCCDMNGVKQLAQAQKQEQSPIRAFAAEGGDKVVHKILLNPKIWVAVFDVIGLILFTQLKVDLEPEVFWSIQAMVLVLIAAVNGD